MPESIDSLVGKRLNDIQARIDLRIELCGAEGSYKVRDNEELVAAITAEVKNNMERQCADAAAISAYMEYQEYYEDSLRENKLSELEAVAVKSDAIALEEERQKMIERFQAMAKSGQLEYLVRGAPLMCICGSHSRHLDMHYSHGIYVNGKAMAFEEDCIVNENISYFGLCNAPECKLTETISLKLGAPVNVNGDTLREEEDFVREGIKCIPDFDGKWQNAYLTTLIAKDGISSYSKALTTASYLICKHGGLIYPFSSGQIDEAYYQAPFQAYPYNDFGSEAFYKWCEENDICPTVAGQPGHAQWHQKKIDEAMTAFGLAKEKYDQEYPANRVETAIYAASSKVPDFGETYLAYENTKQRAVAAYEQCLHDAKLIGRSGMSNEEAKKYGDILQDYLNSGILEPREKEAALSQYGEFTQGYRGSRGQTE